MNTSPLIELNNGVRMPALGLGVFLSTPEQTADAVATAIANGYRLIDTAAAYNNERQVGEGIRRSGVKRDELFITTKLWVADYGPETAMRAFEASLRRLGLDHIDLYLLHWPVPTDLEGTVASYKVAEKLLRDGRVRAIGVCNFQPKHLDDLLARTEVVPALNQVELHPYFTGPEVRAANERHGIITQSWSPIGGAYYRRHASDAPTGPLQDPVITALAAKYRKTPAQIILRWHLDHGFSAIPKSVNPGRIAENFNVFDFALTPAEIAAIDALDTGVRAGGDPEKFTRNSYPITIDA
ncbi:MAG: aldo/keto reductase [Flavobacteriales bacterium]|nr:Morphine 6-dehydrogenase [Flavobacteriales bacterium]MCC6575897.1 aldo/keto reductase [Flavobacteriales bacterium]NUQ14144.1 aldo/keto reductase [Flavobacteriales bacterium]